MPAGCRRTCSWRGRAPGEHTASPRLRSGGGPREVANAGEDGRAQGQGGPAGEEAKRVALDLSEGFDKAFGKLRVEAEHMLKKGQHTRVRIKFRGKQVAELPVAVVAAAEVASLWWAGPLRLLLAHVVGKAVL